MTPNLTKQLLSEGINLSPTPNKKTTTSELDEILVLASNINTVAEDLKEVLYGSSPQSVDDPNKREQYTIEDRIYTTKSILEESLKKLIEIKERL